MTTQSIDTVRVTAQIASAQGAVRRDFGRTLFLTSTTDVPTTAAAIREQRSQDDATVFRSAAEVNQQFAVGTQAREAASVYFQQTPFPKNLLVGSRLGAAQPAFVFGIAPPATIATIAGYGSSTFALGGTDVTVDFTGDTTIANVAASLATGINAAAGFTGVSVTVQGARLIVRVPAGTSIGTGFEDTTETRGVGLFGTGVDVFDTVPVETAVQALTRIRLFDDSWYFLNLDNTIYDTSQADDVASWAQSNGVMLALDSTESGALVTNESTSTLAQVSALGQNRVFGFWSARADHKAVSLAARLSAVNFNVAGSHITAKFKRLPGTAPDVLTSAQQSELRRKRVNFYAQQGGSPIVQEGQSFGTWIDTQYWLDWFVGACQTAAYDYVLRSNRIPQTDAGLAGLVNVLEGVCEIGIRNGGLAPGEVSEPLADDIRRMTGNASFDGTLSNGYLVYIPPIASQPRADYSARIAPTAVIWANYAGAEHEFDIAITLIA